jgi:TonB family protein
VPEPGEVPPTAPSFFVDVDTTGAALDVRVKMPSNHDDINAFALAAVQQASYAPARKDGRPVAAWATVPVAVHTPAATAAAAPLPARCATPGYNPGKVCFDTRPAALTAPTVAWSGPGQPPTPATFWIRLSATGAVEGVRPLVTSSDPRFSDQALARAKTMKFNPAVKNGGPVAAWTQIAVVPAQ